ncbi:MFS transporter [Patescibacteria group bacterium]|nr:MFS transporter [Patescibacteria group bacterium]
MGNSKPSFFLIYFSAFVGVVAFSMVFPLLPIYAKQFAASSVTIGMLAGSFALAQLLSSPFWGILSDRFGRKPIILLGLLGLSLSFLVFAFAANLAALFISRFVQGLFSGAVMPSSRAYIADVTSKENRIKSMGRIGGAIALGVIFGPAIGGFLAQGSLVLPFFVAAAVAALNLVLMFFFLPESLKEKHHFKISIRLAWLSFPQILKGLKGALMPMFVLAFIWSFAMSNNQLNVPLLAIEKFHLGTGAIGIGFGLMGVVSLITQFFLLTPITNFFGRHKTIVGGLLLMALAFAAMPFLPAITPLFYLAMAIAGLGSAVVRPIVTALITLETKEPQGITMGTSNAFESLGRLVGPLLGGLLLGLFGFQTPFLFSAFIIIAVLILILKKTNFISIGRTV